MSRREEAMDVGGQDSGPSTSMWTEHAKSAGGTSTVADRSSQSATSNAPAAVLGPPLPIQGNRKLGTVHLPAQLECGLQGPLGKFPAGELPFLVELQGLPKLDKPGDSSIGLGSHGEIIVAYEDHTGLFFNKYRLDVNGDPCFDLVWCQRKPKDLEDVSAKCRKQVRSDGYLLLQEERNATTFLCCPDLATCKPLDNEKDVKFQDLCGCLDHDKRVLKVMPPNETKRPFLRVVSQCGESYDLKVNRDDTEGYQWMKDVSMCVCQEKDLLAIHCGHNHMIDIFTLSAKKFLNRTFCLDEGSCMNGICCNAKNVFVVGDHGHHLYVYSWTDPGRQTFELTDLGIANGEGKKIHGIEYCVEEDTLMMGIGDNDGLHSLHAYKVNNLMDYEVKKALGWK